MRIRGRKGNKAGNLKYRKASFRVSGGRFFGAFRLQLEAAAELDLTQVLSLVSKLVKCLEKPAGAEVSEVRVLKASPATSIYLL